MKENDKKNSVIEVCKRIYYVIYIPLVLLAVFLTLTNLSEARKGNISQFALLLPMACMFVLSLLLFWFNYHKEDVKYVWAGVLVGVVIGILAFVNPLFIPNLAAEWNKLLSVTEVYLYLVWGEANLLILLMTTKKRAF
ncbi:MAG: hypothetical protein Q4A59_04795 [Erysipelotrichaceae bacterium]|nr:hypothetical protein [Erysipelotrichaceae bacterium]